jgi:hypothetical protein
MKISSLENTVSRVRGGLRLAGIPIQNGHGTPVASPAWQAYSASVGADRPDNFQTFAAWCTKRGIEPAQVTNRVLADHLAALKAEGRKVRQAKVAVRRLVACFKKHPTGSGEAFQVPGLTHMYRLPNDLADRVMREVRLWCQYRQAGDDTMDAIAPPAAEREGKMILAIADQFDPPATSIVDLLDKRRLRAALDAKRQLLKGRSEEAWGALLSTPDRFSSGSRSNFPSRMPA